MLVLNDARARLEHADLAPDLPGRIYRCSRISIQAAATDGSLGYLLIADGRDTYHVPVLERRVLDDVLELGVERLKSR